MKVRELMTHDVEVIEPQATVQEAAEKMRALDIGPIPVCDGSRIVGMITDRDIVVRGVALGRDPRATQVSEVMTPEVTYCFENDDVEKAADLMKEDQIRRLIVLDENKKLVGIIALGDLSQEAGERLTGEVLGKVSEPPGPTLH